MHFELQFKATLQPDDYRFIVANHNGTEIAQTTYFEITEPSAIQGMAAKKRLTLLSIAPPREKRTSVSAMAERWHVPTFTTAEDNGFSSDKPESADGNYRITAGQLHHGIYLLRVVTASGTAHTLKFVR